MARTHRHRTDTACCRRMPYLHQLRTVSVLLCTVSVRIGTASTTEIVRRTCTVCVPLQSICIPLQSVCIPFQSVLGPLRQRDFRCRSGLPIRTETVHKRTEAVCKRCKYGVCLQQAESVLCLCVRAVFPVFTIQCACASFTTHVH